MKTGEAKKEGGGGGGRGGAGARSVSLTILSLMHQRLPVTVRCSEPTNKVISGGPKSRQAEPHNHMGNKRKPMS